MAVNTKWHFLLKKGLRLFYSAVFCMLLPFLLLKLVKRACRNSAYLQHLKERFGRVTALATDRPVIWVHAVSLGGSIAAIPLVRMIQQDYPDYVIFKTASTLTGRQHIANKSGLPVEHSAYAPYDYPAAISRFLKRVHPQKIIILETEIWPNWLYAAEQRQIPVLLANARLSAKSFQSYLKMRWFFKPFLSAYSMVMAQTVLEQERFLSLGFLSTQVMVAGNIKFDQSIPVNLAQEGKNLRTLWQADTRPVWIVASTHKREEAIILEAFAAIKALLPNILLVLVPRHPERFEEVVKLCQDQGYQIARRSLKTILSEQTEIVVGDTVGELFLLYATADLAFVGGSLVPIGGHNMLEPAALGLPVLSGPYVGNFVSIAHMLQQAGVLISVNTASDIAETVLDCFSRPELGQHAGEAGPKVVASQRGALSRHVAWVKG